MSCYPIGAACGLCLRWPATGVARNVAVNYPMPMERVERDVPPIRLVVSGLCWSWTWPESYRCAQAMSPSLHHDVSPSPGLGTCALQKVPLSLGRIVSYDRAE